MITDLGSGCTPAFLVTAIHMTVMLTSMGTQHRHQKLKAQAQAPTMLPAQIAAEAGDWTAALALRYRHKSSSHPTSTTSCQQAMR